jgi:hypothetical protein
MLRSFVGQFSGAAMRWIYLSSSVLAVALSNCAGARPRIVSQTPASVEIDCIGVVSCESRQAVADLAQQHCRQFGLDAQESKIADAPSGNLRAIYNCVDTHAPVATAPRR